MNGNTIVTWHSFESWSDVLSHVRSGAPTYYQAPLDARPVRIDARVVGKRDPKIRIQGSRATFDTFKADSRHLARFRYQIRHTEDS